MCDNADTFIPIFSADTIDSVAAIEAKWKMDHKVQSELIIITNILAGNSSTGTDLAIKFDLDQCITTNKYS